MLAQRAVEGLSGILHPIDAALPFEERLERFVVQRGQLLEALTPIRRAAAIHAPFSPAIQSHLRDGHQFMRNELKATFEPEIGALPRARRRAVRPRGGGRHDRHSGF